MTSTITQTIADQTCVIKTQIEILVAEEFLSSGCKSDYSKKLVILLNLVCDRLLEQVEVANTYPQQDALKDLRSAMDLIGQIAEITDILEKSDFLGSHDLSITSRRLIRSVYKLETPLRNRAFSNRDRAIIQSCKK